MKTPEHFEKKPPAMSQSILCRECMQDEDFQYQVGYNEALEKTNAKELYEALLRSNKLIEALRDKLSPPKYGIIISSDLIQNNIKAIEKANNP